MQMQKPLLDLILFCGIIAAAYGLIQLVRGLSYALAWIAGWIIGKIFNKLS